MLLDGNVNRLQLRVTL